MDPSTFVSASGASSLLGSSACVPRSPPLEGQVPVSSSVKLEIKHDFFSFLTLLETSWLFVFHFAGLRLLLCDEGDELPSEGNVDPSAGKSSNAKPLCVDVLFFSGALRAMEENETPGLGGDATTGVDNCDKVATLLSVIPVSDCVLRLLRVDAAEREGPNASLLMSRASDRNVRLTNGT